MKRQTVKELKARIEALEELSSLLLDENAKYRKILNEVIREYPTGVEPIRSV